MVPLYLCTLSNALPVYLLYQNMKRALASGGVIATQGECLWLHLSLITTVLHACTQLFASVDYAFTTVPSYPSGQIGFIIASVDERGAIKIFPKRGGCKLDVLGIFLDFTMSAFANTNTYMNRSH